MSTVLRWLAISRRFLFYVLSGPGLPAVLPVRRFAHGTEHSALGSQKVSEEFEQHQPRGLHKCHQSLEGDDENVAQDQQQDVQNFVGDAVGHSQNGGRQGSVGQGEGADAQEGQGVQRQLEDILQQQAEASPQVGQAS